MWIPHVVLVAQNDEISVASPDCRFEVLRGAKLERLHGEIDRKARTLGEGFNDLGRCIRRTIVADHAFVGRKILREDARELFLEVSRAVVSAKCDRKFHRIAASFSVFSGTFDLR